MDHDLTQADVAHLELVELANRDPAAALAAVGAHQQDGSLSAGVGAWARGVALRQLGDPGAAAQELGRAFDDFSHRGLDELAARVAVPLAGTRMAAGRFDEALALLETSRAALSGPESVSAAGQQALALQLLGRADEARTAWDETVSLAEEHSLDVPLWTALNNRGLARAYAGELELAREDLRRAKEGYLSAGDAVRSAELTHNEGWIAAQQGNLPLAMRLLDEAQQLFRQHGVARPQMLIDRIEALLDAGLAGEAKRVGAVAAEQLRAADLDAFAAEVHLLLARASEAGNDALEAAEWAESAAKLFEQQGRLAYLPLADLARLRAAASTSAEPGPLAAQVSVTGDALSRGGWQHAAIEAQLLHARLLLNAGLVEESARSIASLVRRRNLPARQRTELHAIRARQRFASGDLRGGRRALAAALDALEEHRSTLGSIELQSAASAPAEELIALGVRAEHERHCDRALWWAETVRETVRLRRPPDDPELAAARLALREVSARVEREQLSERAARDIRRQQAALEEIVRRRSHHATAGANSEHQALDPDAVVTALGRTALVHYVESEGFISALTYLQGEYRCVDLVDAYAIRRSLAALRLELNRAIREDPEATAGAAAVQRAAAALDCQLVAPLWPGDAPTELVVVPGVLGAVPWNLLPTLARSALTVTPSACTWIRGRQALNSELASAGAIAGPGPSHAEREAAEVAAARSSDKVLVDENATVGGALSLLEDVDVAHVAAHGSFRSDNPLLSSIRLADGPLTGYDLATLSNPPTLMVLSCCDIGAQSEETALGLVRLLLSVGVASVIASPNSVEDACSPAFMHRVHDALADGALPAAALLRARQAATSPRDALVAGSFVCYGSG